MIIDVHTHGFPDHIAPAAIEKLEHTSKTKAYLNGTVADLIKSMDRSEITISFLSCVATAPAQFNSIFRWCQVIANPRIVPLPSIHPDSQNMVEEIRLIKEAGFLGLKLHPEYQDFYLDEPRLYPLYQEAVEHGLLILFHCGYDLSFPDSDRSDPKRLAVVHRDFPELSIIASHLGGWRQWERVIEYLMGKNIYLDTSYTLGMIDDLSLYHILNNHPPDKILFGTDSPWKDQQKEIDLINSLAISVDLKERILGLNAENLLHNNPFLS